MPNVGFYSNYYLGCEYWSSSAVREASAAKLKCIWPGENGGAEGIKMTTYSLTPKPRLTKVCPSQVRSSWSQVWKGSILIFGSPRIQSRHWSVKSWILRWRWGRSSRHCHFSFPHFWAFPELEKYSQRSISFLNLNCAGGSICHSIGLRINTIFFNNLIRHCKPPASPATVLSLKARMLPSRV